MINYIKMKKENMYRLYVKTRNFFVNNFFVNIFCIKKNDVFIYLNGNYIIIKYLLLLLPFYLVKLIANLLNYEIIYRIDGIYGITNIKENHIIPFITNCTVFNNDSSLNITNDIRLYNTSIPLSFFINNNQINNYNKMTIIYNIKTNKIEKHINFNEINTNNCLIYHLFDK